MSRGLLLILLASAPLVSQNYEIGLLFNGSINRFNFGPRTETQYRIGVQPTLAWQVNEWAHGRLYVEFATNSASAPVGQTILSEQAGVRTIGAPQGVIFLTPGARYHYNLSPRVAVYAAGGLGAALRRQSVYSRPADPPGPLLLAFSRWQADPAYSVGAGLDFRLTRLWSVRGELRRFRTSASPGFGDGRTFPSVQAGVALHF